MKRTQDRRESWRRTEEDLIERLTGRLAALTQTLAVSTCRALSFFDSRPILDRPAFTNPTTPHAGLRELRRSDQGGTQDRQKTESGDPIGQPMGRRASRAPSSFNSRQHHHKFPPTHHSIMPHADQAPPHHKSRGLGQGGTQEDTTKLPSGGKTDSKERLIGRKTSRALSSFDRRPIRSTRHSAALQASHTPTLSATSSTNRTRNHPTSVRPLGTEAPTRNSSCTSQPHDPQQQGRTERISSLPAARIFS